MTPSMRRQPHSVPDGPEAFGLELRGNRDFALHGNGANSGNARTSQLVGIAIIVFVVLGYRALAATLVPNLPPFANKDPEYNYFLNSLAGLKGLPYYYTDHPGTPVEMLGTGILAIAYQFSAHKTQFVDKNLENPDSFLGVAHGLLTALSIGCAICLFLLALGRVSSPRPRDVLAAAALALLFYAIHPYAFSTLAVWSHTAFNYPLGAGFLVLLVWVSRRSSATSLPMLFLLGIGTGVLTAVMINFLPWVIGFATFVAVSFRIRRLPVLKLLVAMAAIAGGSITGFFLGTLPAVRRLSYFAAWFVQLIAGQLARGLGARGRAGSAVLLDNSATMVSQFPLLFGCVLLAASTFIYAIIRWRKRLPHNPELWALGTALVLQVLVEVGMVLALPGPRYVLPIAATLPVLFIVELQLLEYDHVLQHALGALLVLVTLGGLVYCSIQSIDAADRSRRNHCVAGAGSCAGHAALCRHHRERRWRTGHGVDVPHRLRSLFPMLCASIR